MKEELTTDEIFRESMKLSAIAWKEKGKKLDEYNEWLNQKWMKVEFKKEKEIYEDKLEDDLNNMNKVL